MDFEDADYQRVNDMWPQSPAKSLGSTKPPARPLAPPTISALRGDNRSTVNPLPPPSSRHTFSPPSTAVADKDCVVAGGAVGSGVGGVGLASSKSTKLPLAAALSSPASLTTPTLPTTPTPSVPKHYVVIGSCQAAPPLVTPTEHQPLAVLPQAPPITTQAPPTMTQVPPTRTQAIPTITQAPPTKIQTPYTTTQTPPTRPPASSVTSKSIPTPRNSHAEQAQAPPIPTKPRLSDEYAATAVDYGPLPKPLNIPLKFKEELNTKLSSKPSQKQAVDATTSVKTEDCRGVEEQQDEEGGDLPTSCECDTSTANDIINKQCKYIVKELTDTERHYQVSLKLFLDVFLRDGIMIAGLNKIELISNLEEIIEFSTKFYQQLTHSENLDIVDVLTKLPHQMLDIYQRYYQTYPHVCDKLEKFKENSEISGYFESVVRELNDDPQRPSEVFDVGSILIKPIQRPTKYPLLILNMIKVIQDPLLQKKLNKAKFNFEEIISEFNKRRNQQIITEKYKTTNPGKTTYSKFSLHSAKKMLHRATYNFTDSNMDEEMKILILEFEKVQYNVRQIKVKIEKYMQKLQFVLEKSKELAFHIRACFFDVEDINQDQQFLTAYLNAQHKICSQTFDKFDNLQRSRVTKQLQNLENDIFIAPNNVVKKYQVKLKDRDRLYLKQNHLDEFNEVKNQCCSLEIILRKELNKITFLSNHVLSESLGYFVKIRQNFLNECASLLNHVISQAIKPGEELCNINLSIDRQFTNSILQLTKQISSLSIVPESFDSFKDFECNSYALADPLLNEKSRRISYYETASKMSGDQILEKRFDTLYTVTAEIKNDNFVLKKGQTVGIVKRNVDTRLCWIDTGVIKVEIPESYLEKKSCDSPQQSTKNSIMQQFQNITPVSQNTAQPSTSGHIFNNPENEIISPPEYSLLDPSYNSNLDVYIANWSIPSTSSNCLSFAENELMWLHRPYDHNGNTEWSSVERMNGNREKGNVPSRYIKLYRAHAQ